MHKHQLEIPLIDASADQETEQTGEEPVQQGHEHLAKSEPQVDLSANGEVRTPIEFLYPTGKLALGQGASRGIMLITRSLVWVKTLPQSGEISAKSVGGRNLLCCSDPMVECVPIREPGSPGSTVKGTETRRSPYGTSSPDTSGFCAFLHAEIDGIITSGLNHASYLVAPLMMLAVEGDPPRDQRR
jgi:hypothetical protein